MIVIGDIHGKYGEYRNLLRRYKDQPSVQIGDFGYGFGPVPEFPETAKFFRGNHDSPDECRKSPNYLGEFGVRKMDGVEFFFVSGAWSIDWQGRVPGVSWWQDEELSIAQLNEALALYIETKPDIVLTHDGPNQITERMMARYDIGFHKPLIPNRTAQALSAMFHAHQPKKWIFGHWHVGYRETVEGTDFRCLPELGWCEVKA
jgi:hypothetical protein